MPMGQHKSGAWDLAFSFAPTLAAPSAGDGEDAPLRFSGTAYSGGVVQDYGWLGSIAIDLATLKNPDGQVPVLTDHTQKVDSIAGMGRLRISAAADGTRALTIEGQLTKATPAGRQMADLMREGYPIQMSIGIAAKLRESDEEEQINGATVKVDHVFEHATVREVSFVPVGADSNTNAAAFAFSAKARDPESQPSPKEGNAMARSAEDEALFAEQAARIAALESQVAEAAKLARKAALSALFAEVGRDMPADDKLSAYLSMSAESFDVFAADLRETAKKAKPGRQADPALFSASSAGRQVDGAPAAKPAAALFAAVQKLAAPQTKQ